MADIEININPVTGEPILPVPEPPPPSLVPAPAPEPTELPSVTGNVPTDLRTLEQAGATPAQIAEYMAEYGKSWSVQEDTPGASPAEVEASRVIREAGIRPSAPYIEIESPDPSVGILRIQADLYERATPRQKFDLLQRARQIPKEAVFDEESGGYTIPSAKKYAVGDAGLSKTEMAYIRENDPELYERIRDEGLRDVYAEKADVIENLRAEASLPTELRQIFKSAGGGRTGVDAVNAEIDRQNKAQQYKAQQSVQTTATEDDPKRYAAMLKLRDAGFVEGEVPKVWMGAPETPAPRAFTVAAMADYARNNPDGLQTLVDYGFDRNTINEVNEYNKQLDSVVHEIDSLFIGKGGDAEYYRQMLLSPRQVTMRAYRPTEKVDPRFGGMELAVQNIMQSVGVGTDVVPGAHLKGNGKGMLGQMWIDDKSGKALTKKDILARQWLTLTDEQKARVAPTWDADTYKGSYFAEITKQMSDVAGSEGLLGQVAYGPVLPVTTPLAKQITLKEAKTKLAETYSTELSALKDYVNKDGSFNIKKVNAALEKDPELKKEVLSETGYSDTEKLSQGLEYYNYGTRVTPKEWTVAGLVAILDVVGAGSLMGTGVLPANLVGRLVDAGVPVGLAALIAPDVIKTVKDPSVGGGEKALAIAIEVALVAGGFMALRPSKIAMETIKPVGKVEVPLKPKSIESPVVWKGIKLGDNPIIGISKGKLTVGKAGIEFPPLSEWKLPGAEGMPFEPRTGLETKVIVNRGALERAGMTTERATKFTSDIDRTLSEVHQFYGKKSPNMNAEMLSKPIDTFSQEGVEAILKWIVKNKNIVDRVFGSSAMRPQFTAEGLAEWLRVYGRHPGDIDLMLRNVTPAQAEAAVKDLVAYIKANSKDNPWISTERGTLVENFSKSTGAKRHAIDVHFEGEPTLEAIDVSPSKFAERVYGMSKVSPVVKVKLKGVGEVSMSRLSETGVGKTEQVLGWRRDPKTGDVVLKTEAHRIKDYADLYEIIKTYNGKGAADDWAATTGISDILADISSKQTGTKRLSGLKDDVARMADDVKSNEASLRKLSAELREARSDEVFPIFEGETSGIFMRMLEMDAKIDRMLERGYTKADLEYLIKGLRATSRDIDTLAKRWQPTGVDWSWTFAPSKRASDKYISRYVPVVSVVGASLVSALRSPVIGYTSRGSLVSIPAKLSPSMSSVMVSPTELSSAPVVDMSEYAPEPTSVTTPETPSKTTPGIPAPDLPSAVISPEVPSEPPSVPVSPPPYEPPVPYEPYEPPSSPYEPPPPPSTPLEQPTVKKGLPMLSSVQMIRGRAKLPEGSIAWATGELYRGRGKSRVPVWKWIPPEDFTTGAKPRTLTAPPIGAKNTNSRIPAETIQMIGLSGSPVPERISVDQGVIDIYVSDGGTKISFTGGGLKTDVGTRISSPTTGMSVEEGGSTYLDDFKPELTRMRSIGRPLPKKRATTRKVKRDDFTLTTSLKGLKL